MKLLPLSHLRTIGLASLEQLRLSGLGNIFVPEKKGSEISIYRTPTYGHHIQCQHSQLPTEPSCLYEMVHVKVCYA